MFDRIVYVSRAAPGVGPRDVYDIIRAAHNRNGVAGLTGGLLFLDGHFVQVLEGERHRLDERLARIVADPRHEALDLRLRATAEQRLFPGEWMALRQRADIDEALLAQHGYQPGLPGTRFDGASVEALVLACCARAAVV